MFNIVKHRDFMLADDLPTWPERIMQQQERF